MSHVAAPKSGTTPGSFKKTKRRQWSRLLCLLGLVVSGLALSSPWLSFYNPLFDFLSHFTLHYLLAFLAFLAGYFMPRARLFTTLLIMIAGVAAIAWWPQYVSHQPGAPAALQSGERQLRMMMFNTWLSNKDWRAVTAEVRRHNPDIVTLMEFGKEKLKAIDDLKGDYPYSVNCIDKAYCHMAIISKYPLYDMEARSVWKGPAFISARLGKKFGRIYIYGLHATRPPFVRSQVIQLQTMAKRLHAVPGPKIVMGDFNATPYAQMLEDFATHSALRRVTFLPTWPSRWGPFPQLAIDHVFLSQGTRALNEAWIGKPAGSDHFPTIIDVAIKTSPQ